jgi:hypothetical protein
MGRREERFVAAQLTTEALRSKYSAEHTDGGAGIAAIEEVFGAEAGDRFREL